MNHTPRTPVYTTHLVFPRSGGAEDIVTTGTQDDHRRAVHARVAAQREAYRQSLVDAHDAASQALQATYGSITYGRGKTPEQIAQDDQNRRKASELRSAAGDAHRAVLAYDERRKRFFRWTPSCTPEQARKAVRLARKQAPPKPSAAAFSAGSWVRWTDPGTDAERTGVVTCDGWAYTGRIPSGQSAVRYIVPADGGEMLPMCPRGRAPGGDWRCQHPDWKETADVLPAPVPE